MTDRCEPPEKLRSLSWSWHWIWLAGADPVPCRWGSGFWWLLSKWVSPEDAAAFGYHYIGPAWPLSEIMSRLREPEVVERLADCILKNPPATTVSGGWIDVVIHRESFMRAVLDAIERELSERTDQNG